ncbi:MAG: zinc carboxypeptidase [Burkholderiales bacterium]|nr:zinc carboxypeptidase [Burkholderiales bacterium]MBK9346285.1 zinc carboxypeptidase [Burkholderiales bacterium]
MPDHSHAPFSAPPPPPAVQYPHLPEMQALEATLALGGSHLDTRVVHQVRTTDPTAAPLALYCIALGNPSPEVPAIGFFGGVHGLERIGSEVVIAFLNSVVMRLKWDATLHQQLESLRLVFMPIVNPGGMWMGTRANPRGVDLMRNAPIEAVDKVPYLVGGQRIGPTLPWYRGRAGDPMEAENQALCATVHRELLSHPFSMVLDCHSGFGVRDRIWFPYAHTREPIAHLAEMRALKQIFRQSYTHHAYVFEPQSLQYLAHGDVWDYLYQQACTQAGRVFLPLTLEMGSWLWIKKNPRQMFSLKGLFNPLIEHRQNRVLRRHLSLLDFLTRAASSHALWIPPDHTRQRWHRQALRDWYGA